MGARFGDVTLLLQGQWTGVTDFKCTGKAAFGTLYYHPSLMWLRPAVVFSPLVGDRNPPDWEELGKSGDFSTS